MKKMKKIKFSIITPCYNSEKTIKRTIESVVNQSYKNIEYILIDGGSKDKTVEIIQEYQSKYPKLIKYISEKDSGIYDAMNKGIKLATGDIVGIVNSDDYYELDALKNIYNNYDYSNEYLIIYGMIRAIKNDKEYMVYNRNHEFLNEQMINHPACFVTKKTYDDFGLYSLKYKLSSDYEFMLRCFNNKKVKFKGINNIISNFSYGGASGSPKALYENAQLKKEYNLISKYQYFKMIIKYYIVSVERKITKRR